MAKRQHTTGEPLHIALVGTRGVPAKYGGFETAIEEIGQRLVERGHRVTVYCRNVGDSTKPVSYKGMDLVFLPALRLKSLETLSHTGLSTGHLMFNRPDSAIVFNAANAPWLPFIRAAKIPVATHVDGLEWKRAKWGPIGQRYYLVCERLAVLMSNWLISDARGIADYYVSKFGVKSRLITYGAPIIVAKPAKLVQALGLVPGKFHLVVARFEPENHVDVIVEGYSKSEAKLPLVVVGSAPYSERYTARIQEHASENVRFLGGVWDQELLDELYAHAYVYWHGHSVGGTNPSLLRAIGAGTAVNAFDVNFNREVLESAGEYFRSAADAGRLFERSEADSSGIRRREAIARIRAEDYDWESVTDRYEGLCIDLASGSSRVRRSTSRDARMHDPSRGPEETENPALSPSPEIA